MDSKGRVAVPKKFREGMLGIQSDYVGMELVVTNGLSNQLFVFSPEGFDDFARRYDALPCEDADLLDRYFGAGAFDCTLDVQGRILLPARLKSFAALNKEVVWVGQRGPNSVRGFSRSSLGPSRAYTSNLTDPSSTITNFEIGGNKEIVFNAELEIPILKAMNISGVVFFDMGNAYNEDQDLSLKIDWFAKSDEELDSVMRSSMGFGFRWLSPMGLLRFEWGFPLNPKKNEDNVVFEFSIGNAF